MRNLNTAAAMAIIVILCISCGGSTGDDVHPSCQNIFKSETEAVSNNQPQIRDDRNDAAFEEDTGNVQDDAPSRIVNLVTLPSLETNIKPSDKEKTIQLSSKAPGRTVPLQPSEVTILRTRHTYLDDSRVVIFDEFLSKDFIDSFTETKFKQLNFASRYTEQLEAVGKLQTVAIRQYGEISDQAEKIKFIDNLYPGVITLLLDTIFPLWLGTPWDFNGTTQQPQKGEIACGYFVSTTLRDAGFNVQRVKLAQQASMNIMKTVCDRDTIITHKSVAKLIETVKSQGDGLYITGLSDHVGYILNRGGQVDFCHSFGKVMWEDAATSPKLNSSRYLSTGKIGRYAMGKWLDGSRFETVTSRRKPVARKNTGK